ncbi:NAD(P)-binding protein [Lojkania enalia]|uniref:NAD(P)-binding protein n=1 Tax=Lojkania enalia TaxID=147567 RepID=A0A9P4K7T2_9PLEO|nr:NAD(P)-binding protein [Didymosphaeria enalia]
MELKNVAIIGPRGNVGSAIISELLKNGNRFNITAISRPTSTYSTPKGSCITIKTVDFGSLESLSSAFQGQDAVINCVSGGATQYEPYKLIIDAAVAAGVKLFFANEFVGNLLSEQFKRLPETFVGAKVRIRQYLEELGKEGKINWTALNGGPFFDMWLMKGPAGFDIPNKRARIYGTGESKLCWTPLPTIAFAAANMLRKPYLILNRPVYISNIPGLTQNAILAAVEPVLATKFNVEYIDIKKINENARTALERGEIPKAMRGLTISNQFYEEDSGSDFSALVENDLVGVQPVSVEVAVRDAIAKWGAETPVVETMFNVNPCEI